MTREFRNIYIPAPDVYESGGTEVFTELAQDESDKESNLLVIPENYLQQLSGMKGFAVEDALKKVEEISARQRDGSDPVGVVHGLEAVILSESESASETAVQQYVRENFVLTSAEDDDWQPTFMSNDARTSIALNRRGLYVQESQFIQVDEDIVLEGIIEGNDAVGDALYSSKDRSIPLEQAVKLIGREQRGMDINQFVRLRGPGKTGYARVTGDFLRDSRGTRITAVENPRLQLLGERESSRRLRIGDHVMDDVLGIQPRDMEQYLAMQYGLLNPDVETMFLTGSQGSGKTLLSYVCALDQTMWWDKPVRDLRGDEGKGGRYSHMLLLKPTDVMGGREIGFLPGDMYQKLEPHLRPYIDSHKEAADSVARVDFKQLALHPSYANKWGPQRDRGVAGIVDQGKLNPKREVIEIEHSGFIRGRSVPNTLLLIDEAQNYTPYELKTILERTGEGTKAVVMGDPYQQDNPRNTRKVNGLTHAIKQFKDKPYSMLVALSENYRSQMSEDSREWKAYPR